MTESTAVAEYVDPETGEVKPQLHAVQQKERFDNSFDLAPMIAKAGTVALTDEQKAILYAEVDPGDVEIRPDGLIYLPWMEYMTRLRKAFGLSWAHIPNGMPTVKGNYMYWGFYLVINGSLMSFAIGEQQYFPGSRSMSYGTPARGPSRTRLCGTARPSGSVWNSGNPLSSGPG